MEHILKYFPSLSDTQKEQFRLMTELYPQWNEKINVISRKDIANVEVNHILHSLAIAKFINFKPGSRVLDFGSGGGLPGLPLAVMFPEVHFHLIDRIGKKMKVAREISEALGLKNVTVQHGDAGECHDKFDFVVSRAVMSQTDLVKLAKRNISTSQRNGLPNGVITLKGGDIQAEIFPLRTKTEVVDIKNYFKEDFFDTKKIVYTIA
ncbi:MAG: 16S rRNA (guanine(527)-N(7))-methyltransferase RsmG [Muribaculaceae bacterium]